MTSTRHLLALLTIALLDPTRSLLAAAPFPGGGTSLTIQDPDDPNTSSKDLIRLAREKREAAKLLVNELGKTKEASDAYREGSVYLFDVIIRGDAQAETEALFLEMSESHVDLLIQMGNLEEARNLLERTLDPKGWPKDDWEHARKFLESLPASSTLRQRLGQLRGEGTQIAASASGLDSAIRPAMNAAQDIDTQVAEAARAGRTAFVVQIGERAAPGLIRVLMSEGDRFYEDFNADPLYMLYRVSATEADAFVAEYMREDQRSLFKNLRFSTIMSKAGVLGLRDNWSHAPYGKAVSLLPNTIRICEELLSIPDVQARMETALQGVTRWQLHTPAMLDYLRSRASDPNRWSHSLRKWLATDVEAPNPALYSVLVDLLQSPNEMNQIPVVRRLRYYPTIDALVEALPTLGTSIRKGAIDWLSDHPVFLATEGNSEAPDEAFRWSAPRNEAIGKFVDQLLRDPSPIVRQETLAGIPDVFIHEQTVDDPSYPGFEAYLSAFTEYDFGFTFRTETLLALAQEPASSVTRALAEVLEYLPAEHAPKILRTLAAGKTYGVWRYLYSMDWRNQFDEAIATTKYVLAAGAGNPKLDTWEVLRGLSDETYRAMSTSAGIRACARWAVEDDHPQIVQRMLGSKGEPHPNLGELDPKLWAQCVALLSGMNMGSASAMAQAAPSQQHRVAALVLLGESPNLSATEMGILLCASGDPSDDRYVAGLANFVEVYDYDRQRGALNAITRSFRNASEQRVPLAEDLLLALIQRGNLNGEQIQARVLDLFGVVRLTPRSVGAIQANAPDLGYQKGLVNSAIIWMGSNAQHADTEWLRSMLQKPSLAGTVLTAMGRTRIPDLLTDLGKVIREGEDLALLRTATKALEHFFSDESAELLLVAARRTGDAELRSWCLEQLEKIQELQDAEGRWASRRVKQATREATVSRLMGLLNEGDDNVRVEAIRALATWEAVEALPDLIELLGASSETVAHAAKAALDVLNRR